jgi:N-acetylglutamate synthase-like GNAT family acetyltransferase
MTSPANKPAFQLLPFNQTHQPGIDLLMTEIQKEFSEIFTAPNSKSMSELAAQAGETFWVALSEEQVIGTIGLSQFDAGTAILKRMFLHKKHRGENKIAQKLLDTAILEATKSGVNTIYLGTMAQFTGAQKFYSKNNFIRISKTDLPAGMTLSVLDTVFFKLTIAPR